MVTLSLLSLLSSSLFSPSFSSGFSSFFSSLFLSSLFSSDFVSSDFVSSDFVSSFLSSDESPPKPRRSSESDSKTIARFSFKDSNVWFSFKFNLAWLKPGVPTKSYVLIVDNVTLPPSSIEPAPRELINNGQPPSTIAFAILPFGVSSKRIVPVIVPSSFISIDSIL